VRIIHGSGAGVLRRVVAEVCADHPEVASCGPEQDTPGGSGVTGVILKGSEG
jgi:dsDNA-specific endonuclease/ATPase MutS2